MKRLLCLCALLAASAFLGVSQTVKIVNPIRDTCLQYQQISEGSWTVTPVPSSGWGRIGHWTNSQVQQVKEYVGIQWVLPDSLLPNGTPVDSVQIQTDVASVFDPQFLAFTRLPSDLRSMTGQAILEFVSFSPDSISCLISQPGLITIRHRGSERLVGMVKDALDSNRLALVGWWAWYNGYSLEAKVGHMSLTIWYDTVEVVLKSRGPRGETLPECGFALKLPDPQSPGDSLWAPVGAGDTTLGMYHDRTEQLLTSTAIFANVGWPWDTVKFFRWEVNSPVPTPWTTKNAARFQVQAMTLVARYWSVGEVTIDARLLETDLRGDSILIKDPWYSPVSSVQNEGHDAIFRSIPVCDLNMGVYRYPTYRKGVILNVEAAQQPSNPYSVYAPSRAFGSVEGHLGWWKAHPDSVTVESPLADSTVVVFKKKQSRVTAIYKGHLISTLPLASGPSSQRKVVTRGSETHLVYVSAGTVWYSKNSGEGWTPERPLSAVEAAAANPSIAAKAVGTGEYHVYATWEERLTSDTTKSRVPCAYSLNGGQTWTSPQELDAQAAYPATPAVSGQITPVIVWKGHGTGLRMRLEPYRTASHQVYSVTGTDVTTREFSVAESYQNPTGSHAISYVRGPAEDGDVWVTTFSVVSVFQPTGWQAVCLTNGYPWMTGCGSTTIATDQSGAALSVAWDARGMGALSETGTDTTLEVEGVDRRIFFRTKSSSGWGPLTYLEYTYRSLAASVGYDWDAILQGSRLNVLWQDYFGNAVSHTVGSPGFFNLGPGRSPGRVEYTSTGLPWRFWMATGAAPHALVLTQPEGPIFEEGIEQRTKISARRSRVAVVCLDSISIPGVPPGAMSGHIQIHVSGPALKCGSQLQGIPFSAGGPGEGRWLKTATARVPTTADSLLFSATLEAREVLVNEEEVPLNTSFLEVGLVEGGKTVGVRNFTLGALREWSRRDTSIGIRMRLPMRGMRGRDIHVEVRLLGEAEGYSPAVAELIRGVPPDSSQEELSGEVLDVATDPLMPVSFMSHAGYPNPFNPTTQIRFELPEASTVTLAVFDLLGRKVADLTAGEYDAGYHSATWNAAGVASGVYLARFTATTGTGSVVYTKTHKLVLMR